MTDQEIIKIYGELPKDPKVLEALRLQPKEFPEEKSERYKMRQELKRRLPHLYS